MENKYNRTFFNAFGSTKLIKVYLELEKSKFRKRLYNLLLIFLPL